VCEEALIAGSSYCFEGFKRGGHRSRGGCKGDVVGGYEDSTFDIVGEGGVSGSDGQEARNVVGDLFCVLYPCCWGWRGWVMGFVLVPA
jgi:hypothetical protein